MNIYISVINPNTCTRHHTRLNPWAFNDQGPAGSIYYNAACTYS